MAWSVLKSMIFFVDPYSVLASAFQHLPANIAVDSPKCETVAFFTTPSSLGGGLGGFGEALGRPLNSKNPFFFCGILIFFLRFSRDHKKKSENIGKKNKKVSVRTPKKINPPLKNKQSKFVFSKNYFYWG